jgi:hypothetical protein
MGKLLLFLVVVGILAFWYFQPQQFNNIVTTGKNTIGGLFNKQPVVQPTNQQQTQQNNVPGSEGYCAINGACQYVSSTQCLGGALFNSRSECETSMGINITTAEVNTTNQTTEIQLSGPANYGKPRHADGVEYSCLTDLDCIYDNVMCRDKICMCNYPDGTCYVT